MPANDPRDTPAMQQYFRFKQRNPGCVLLFRMGDFYETFDEDAVTLSKALGLTLTQRSQGLPMAGVPYHQLEVYLRRLVQMGFRVAVAEQVQDPKEAKGLVERAVTRVVTPGTLVDDALLNDAAPCCVGAVCFTAEGDDSPASVAIVEVSTGSFVLADCTRATIADELARHGVSELLYCAVVDDKPPTRVQRVIDALQVSATARPAWEFRREEALRVLREQFGVATLKGFGLDDADPAIAPAGVVVAYLRHTQAGQMEEAPGAAGAGRRPTLSHLKPPRRLDPADRCVVDAVSLRALEVERTIRSTAAGGRGTLADASLLGLLLGTPRAFLTPMGKRLMRDRLCAPSARLETIGLRQRAVASFVSDRRAAEEIGQLLRDVQDVARIAGRLALLRATPRDLVGLGRSLCAAEKLLPLVEPCEALRDPSRMIHAAWETLRPVATEISRLCVDSPPATLKEGGLIRDGADASLDESRLLERDAGAWLTNYQETLAKDLGVSGLKIGYNRVFGYSIELSGAQAKALAARGMPASFVRKQTLKNAERFTTSELAEFETKIAGARQRALERERQLFDGLCTAAITQLNAIADIAQAIAELDVAHGLAERAARSKWVCPDLVAEPRLAITQGRHPVLEELRGTEFVPNDVDLGMEESARLALITGPNMAGKSTFIRQTALIVLLAHAGSFVPAERATIGVTDRIFTRIGADDALHAGQSTFMVEMTETANILNHATERSLVVLDEIGRGTSTLDGLSLAWAIAEFLAGRACRTLFATHYHELTDLEEQIAGKVRNLHVSVKEWPGKDGHHEIIFLHRILPGRTSQSYGIQVARLAGLPHSVVARARELLESLAVHHGPGLAPVAVPTPTANGQLSLFTEYLRHPAVDSLRELKMESLTPLQAFDELRKLKQSADGD